MRGRKRILNLEVWNKTFKEKLEKNGLRFTWFSSCGINKKNCSFDQSKIHGYAKTDSFGNIC
jgi:hypothetical protein